MKTTQEIIVDAIIFARSKGHKFYDAPCYGEFSEYIHPIEAVLLANGLTPKSTNYDLNYYDNYRNALSLLGCNETWLDSFMFGFAKIEKAERTIDKIKNLQAYQFGIDLRHKLKL